MCVYAFLLPSPGEEVDMAENADPHMAAVLIKMFLRELPEPLLTFDSYKTVMGIRGEAITECSRKGIPLSLSMCIV